ncbi:MAG: hypothetical protein RSC92_05425, partial [Clostridia bacterium]
MIKSKIEENAKVLKANNQVKLQYEYNENCIRISNEIIDNSRKQALSAVNLYYDNITEDLNNNINIILKPVINRSEMYNCINYNIHKYLSGGIDKNKAKSNIQEQYKQIYNTYKLYNINAYKYIEEVNLKPIYDFFDNINIDSL